MSRNEAIRVVFDSLYHFSELDLSEKLMKMQISNATRFVTRLNQRFPSNLPLTLS